MNGMKYSLDMGFGSFCFNLDWPKDVDDNLKHELKL